MYVNQIIAEIGSMGIVWAISAVRCVLRCIRDFLLVEDIGIAMLICKNEALQSIPPGARTLLERVPFEGDGKGGQGQASMPLTKTWHKQVVGKCVSKTS